MIHAAYRSEGGFGAGASRRSLILHDTLAFAVLSAVTLVLYGVTFFLFRSFESHRDDLATKWAEQGREELAHNQPAAAVESLRAALGYRADDYQSQLLLAQALAASNQLDQATEYFLNLWSERPGDGFINLQLARLARRKGDRVASTDYYRAAISGDWQSEGAVRRRDVRLELIRYLLELKDYAAVRAEVLISAGNNPSDHRLDLVFGDTLREAGDPVDALTFYGRAMMDDPKSATAYEQAGRLEFAQGNYATARQLLDEALEYHAIDPATAAMAHDAGRLVELSLSRELPAHERTSHLIEAARIAQARLRGCVTPLAAAGGAMPAELENLEGRWKASSRVSELAENAAGQDALTQLIFDTEHWTVAPCGAPTGDDRLLLKLADAAKGAH